MTSGLAKALCSIDTPFQASGVAVELHSALVNVGLIGRSNIAIQSQASVVRPPQQGGAVEHVDCCLFFLLRGLGA